MPCYWPDEATDLGVIELKDKLDVTEAYLCAIMKVLEKNRLVIPTMMHIDVKEAGVCPDDILKWWVKHNIKDDKRGV